MAGLDPAIPGGRVPVGIAGLRAGHDGSVPADARAGTQSRLAIVPRPARAGARSARVAVP